MAVFPPIDGSEHSFGRGCGSAIFWRLAQISPVLDMLRHAALIQGRSLSDFVVCSAREAAERAIAEHNVLALSVADQKLFAECLLSPEPVLEPLERAAG